MASSSSDFMPLAEAPRSLDEITAQEHASQFPAWNASIAFRVGLALRTRLLTFPKATVIDISTFSNPAHILFHAVTHSGTTLDNDYWVTRKRNSVIRWGCSTWRLHNVWDGGDEEKFASKMALGERAGEYAIHGGGVPVYAKGVDTPVAVVVVSGLKQWDDHMVVVEELARVCGELEREG